MRIDAHGLMRAHRIDTKNRVNSLSYNIIVDVINLYSFKLK